MCRLGGAIPSAPRVSAGHCNKKYTCFITTLWLRSLIFRKSCAGLVLCCFFSLILVIRPTLVGRPSEDPNPRIKCHLGCIHAVSKTYRADSTNLKGLFSCWKIKHLSFGGSSLSAQHHVWCSLTLFKRLWNAILKKWSILCELLLKCFDLALKCLCDAIPLLYRIWLVFAWRGMPSSLSDECSFFQCLPLLWFHFSPTVTLPSRGAAHSSPPTLYLLIQQCVTVQWADRWANPAKSQKRNCFQWDQLSAPNTWIGTIQVSAWAQGETAWAKREHRVYIC